MSLMKYARLTSRLAVGGVTAALATAGLVGISTTSASAAPVSSTYTCTTPFGPVSGSISVDIALLPPTAPAGFPVAAGLFSFKSDLTVSDATATGLSSAGVTGAKSDDFGTAFGDTVAKAPVVWSGPPTSTGGNTTFAGKGANAAFLLPKAGSYTVAMPKTFTLLATNSSGATVVTAPCTTTAPATIGTIVMSKQASKVKAKFPASAKKGAVVTVKGKVTNDYVKTGGPAATGKVIVKDGKKTVGKGTLKNGKFTVKVKGLAVGSHSLTVSYKGDDFTDKGVSKAKKLAVRA
jgi:Bacterial Ig-like domain (group 3)